MGGVRFDQFSRSSLIAHVCTTIKNFRITEESSYAVYDGGMNKNDYDIQHFRIRLSLSFHRTVRRGEIRQLMTALIVKMIRYLGIKHLHR